jgi:hypothetical protein
MNSVIDYASWMSAIGTVGAFIGSLILLGIQVKDRKKEISEKRSSQARLVSAWCEETKKDFSIVWAQNNGDEPIYHVVVRVGRWDTDFNSPPDSEENNMYWEVVFGNIPPKTKQEFNVPNTLVSRAVFPDIPSIEIEFTDTRGIYWSRNRDGLLQEISHRRSYD